MQKPSFAIQGSYSGEEMMGIIGHTRVIISMRLHTLIFAAVQRVPMIGLVYDPKVRSFLDAVGQPVAGIDSTASMWMSFLTSCRKCWIIMKKWYRLWMSRLSA